MTARDTLAQESRRSAPTRSPATKMSDRQLASVMAYATPKGKPAQKPQPQTKSQAKPAAAAKPAPQPARPLPQRPVILTNEQRAQKKAAQKARSTRRKLWVAAAVTAVFGAATAFYAANKTNDQGTAVIEAAPKRAITVIEPDPRPVIKDQTRIAPTTEEYDGVERVKAFSIVVNPKSGKSCYATEGKTVEDCRAEVGLPPLKKLRPLPAIDVDAERTRLAALEAERIEKQRLAALETARIEQLRLEAQLKAEAAALAARPKRVAFAEALQPESLFPVKGLEVPDGDSTRIINLKDRYRMSAATMKAEDLQIDSVLAWHNGKAITVETALRHMNIWRLPKPEDMTAFKSCLEKHGFQPIPLADLTHIEKLYGLPAGIMAKIYAKESGGYQCTESWTHARGPLQVMPITQKHMMDVYGLGRGNMYELAEAAHITGHWLRHYKKAYNIGRFSNEKQTDILMAFYVQGPAKVATNIRKDGTLVVENLTCAAKSYVPGSKQRCGPKGRDTVVADSSGPNLLEALGNLFSAPKSKRTGNRTIMSLQPGN